ncbi:unnamed protein product [Lampetra planeri]
MWQALRLLLLLLGHQRQCLAKRLSERRPPAAETDGDSTVTRLTGRTFASQTTCYGQYWNYRRRHTPYR